MLQINSKRFNLRIILYLLCQRQIWPTGIQLPHQIQRETLEPQPLNYPINHQERYNVETIQYTSNYYPFEKVGPNWKTPYKNHLAFPWKWAFFFKETIQHLTIQLFFPLKKRQAANTTQTNQLFLSITNNPNPDHLAIYTDGSVCGTTKTASCTFYVPKHQVIKSMAILAKPTVSTLNCMMLKCQGTWWKKFVDQTIATWKLFLEERKTKRNKKRVFKKNRKLQEN